MAKLRRFLIRMFIFLVVGVVVATFLFDSLISSFYTNPTLNGLIISVLLIGIIYTFRQVFILGPEIRWLELVKSNRLRRSSDSPKLLSSIARILGDSPNISGISALASRSMLDGVSLRLEESREISRYFIGLLVFLGLLGTFWGLLETISSVGEIIKGISVVDEDILSTFSSLKSGLEKPLSGMGTAFSSSLFGLAGSLILGFLDLQSGQAQNQFYNELEEWFATLTTVSPSSGFDAIADDAVPSYVQALLQQTAEATNKLHRTLERGEIERKTLSSAMANLAEQMSQIADKVRSGVGTASLDEASLDHIRSMDNSLKQLLNETKDGRDQLINELREEIKILAKTISLAQSNNSDGN